MIQLSTSTVNTAAINKEITRGKGFVVLPNLVSADKATAARNLILELAQQDKQNGNLVIQEKKERLYGLIYRGDVFADLVQNQIILEIVEEILGEDIILGGFSAHILHPGAKSMGIHVDYPYWAMPAPFPKYPILEIQVIWMLEDFTVNNGAPVFAAGTQKLATQPNKWQFKLKAKRITGSAGSAIISHGLCWHDTSDNKSDRSRVSLLGNYTPQYVHPLENNLFAHQPDMITNASPQLKKLLRHTWMDKTDPMYNMRFIK
ncbi:MAG: phytanoyl-CoA dioxygenase family protein [Cyanobacteria bacterium P01_A01_bin.83]